MDRRDAYAAYNATYDDLILAMHTVQMTGSDGLVESLDSIQTSHAAVHDVIGEAVKLMREGGEDALVASPVHDIMRGGFEEELRPLDDGMEEVINLARADLGLEG